MTPRRVLLPLLAALLVGACGGSETEATKFIAQSKADAFQTTLSAVESNLDAGRCNAAGDRIAGLRNQVGDWPSAYDTQLVANVSEWIDHLEGRLDRDCGDEEKTPTPTETPEETPTPTPTVTQEPTVTPEATATPEATPTPQATPELDIPEAIPGPGDDGPPTGGAQDQDG